MKGVMVTAVVVAIIGAALLAGAFISPLFVYRYSPYEGSYGPGMVNGGMMAYYGQTVPLQTAMMGATSSPPHYVTVIPSNDTVVIDSSSPHITAYAMMSNMAVNVTGHQLPSYSKGDVFVIYGLINPTLVFASKSVTLTVTLVNLDDDMYHNLVVTQGRPPYGYYTASMMSSGYMMPYLPPTNGVSAYEYAYTIQLYGPAQLWYICTYPGHAENGMYGEIIMR